MKGIVTFITVLILVFITGLVTAQNKNTKETVSWKLGLALYSYNASSLPEELEFANKSGIKFIEGFSFGKAGAELKDSIIMTLSPSGILKIKALIKKSGLQMESMYVTGGNTIAQWKRDFELAKALELKFVTGEPDISMLNSVDSLAGLYGIKVALHNHWKGASQYWHPDSTLAALKGHPNFGVCADVRHYPKSGIIPEEALKKLAGHVMALHLADIAGYNDTQLRDAPVGTGVVNFSKIFDELKRQNFHGTINIERDQQDLPNNLISVKQIVSYYLKTLGLTHN